LNKHLANIKEKAGMNKTLIQNFSYLSAMQIFNLLLPLISYPYLIRVIGKETFGLITFAQAIVGYLVIVVGFGFNISATKEVSIHRDNKEKLCEILSNVFIIKSLLCILSFIILFILLFFIPQAHGYEKLFLLCMWACVYDIIFPTWYFQGIEQMKYITVITLIGRLFFLCLIFVLIHSPKDYLFVPAINGIGALLTGFFSLFIIFGKHKIKFKLQSYSSLKFYFMDSLPIFISNVSVKVYVNTSKVIIGTFLGMTEVAYYDLAEKITSVLKIPQSILGQSVFPKINRDKNVKFVRKLFNISIVVNIFLLILTLIFAKYIIILLGGKQMVTAVWVVNILTITIPIVAMSNIFGVQLLIPFGYAKKFSQIIIASGIFYVLQFLIVWQMFYINIYIISVLTLTTEIFVTSVMYYYCKKFKLW
jgi:O-antigen/teichoic acid export membrane protein